jgi:hypothetical protein
VSEVNDMQKQRCTALEALKESLLRQTFNGNL